ncbi:unnamed protein product [Kluyveromyces dobzhanskii CBS 2104]|uniref:WGS project CCBQ000000000 data, contig 00106 n=1 Tax=Kluyveromyces dobzhanskii CBS 2104 TaxID=1427455 RepID=A0A0A8L7Z8_9SACH|nr:unnamed protein product [Kluyveromyces dobzhanskii CBS 2104]
MFSKLSFNNITDSISNAAQRTQEQFSSAIEKIHLDDPETRLSILKRRHQLQETLGTVHDISQLPVQYKFLEQKSDALEKICKRLLLVTKTFEVDGYDYPPNLTESFNDWWSGNKDSIFAFSKKKPEVPPELNNATDNGLLPRSFAQALSKASTDSALILKQLKAEENKGNQEELSTSADKDTEHSAAKKTEVEEEDEDEDEDVENLIKTFEAWTKCQLSIDQSKAEMDSLMVKEFNSKLTKFIDSDFKKGHEMRAKVQDARLKFDTLRHEIKLKQQVKETEASTAEAGKKVEPEATQENAAEKPAEEFTEVSKTEEDADGKLFEQLEDQFVSATSETVEFLGELTDSSEIISLVKLFHNFQLIHYKQCVKSLEEDLEVLNALDPEDK